MKALIVGKKINNYKKDGEEKVSRELYVLKEAPKHPLDGLEGQTTEIIFVPFEIPEGVKVGMYCDFEYEIQQTRKGALVRLVDIVPLKPQLLEVRDLK